ncbi:hypothetical protein ABIC16_002322 [Sphingomonas sp. PvP055]|uniref:hypothetical protein n=1 Tax=Sphingomonas sp. PvP055 TaxID=3156391 RepID=UPI00339861AA
MTEPEAMLSLTCASMAKPNRVYHRHPRSTGLVWNNKRLHIHLNDTSFFATAKTGFMEAKSVQPEPALAYFFVCKGPAAATPVSVAL